MQREKETTRIQQDTDPDSAETMGKEEESQYPDMTVQKEIEQQQNDPCRENTRVKERLHSTVSVLSSTSCSDDSIEIYFDDEHFVHNIGNRNTVEPNLGLSNNVPPMQSTPEQRTPEQRTPEQSTPEQSTPEHSTPEQSTPEQSTPESSVLYNVNIRGEKVNINESRYVTCRFNPKKNSMDTAEKKKQSRSIELKPQQGKDIESEFHDVDLDSSIQQSSLDYSSLNASKLFTPEAFSNTVCAYCKTKTLEKVENLDMDIYHCTKCQNYVGHDDTMLLPLIQEKLGHGQVATSFSCCDNMDPNEYLLNTDHAGNVTITCMKCETVTPVKVEMEEEHDGDKRGGEGIGVEGPEGAVRSMVPCACGVDAHMTTMSSWQEVSCNDCESLKKFETTTPTDKTHSESSQHEQPKKQRIQDLSEIKLGDHLCLEIRSCVVVEVNHVIVVDTACSGCPTKFGICHYSNVNPFNTNSERFSVQYSAIDLEKVRGKIFRLDYVSTPSASEIVQRATSNLGRKSTDSNGLPFYDNATFATWCINGKSIAPKETTTLTDHFKSFKSAVCRKVRSGF